MATRRTPRASTWGPVCHAQTHRTFSTARRARFAAMAEIRALERDDLPAVAQLLRHHLPDQRIEEATIAATYLDDPWRDSDLSALVALDRDGSLIGFVGARVRRMRFDRKPVIGLCCTQLFAAPGHRAEAPGAMLLRHQFSGPQDITWSDSATDPVVRAWRALGGHVDHARAGDFLLTLRASRWIRNVAGGLARERKVERDLVPVPAFPIQALPARLTRREPTPRHADVDGEDASPGAIIEQTAAALGRVRLLVAWDEPELTQLLAEITRRRGPVVLRLVRRRGSPIGWYMYLLRKGGVSRVLCIGATERSADAVLQELLDDAHRRGSAAVMGRAEPHLEAALRQRYAAIGFARQPVIHARDPQIAATLATDRSLLTRLDGEVFVI